MPAAMVWPPPLHHCANSALAFIMKAVAYNAPSSNLTFSWHTLLQNPACPSQPNACSLCFKSLCRCGNFIPAALRQGAVMNAVPYNVSSALHAARHLWPLETLKTQKLCLPWLSEEATHVKTHQKTNQCMQSRCALICIYHCRGANGQTRHVQHMLLNVV